jgi:hypothetical protein
MQKKIFSSLLLAAGLLIPLAARAYTGPAVYLLGGADAKMLTNTDVNNYFNVSGVIGPQGHPSQVYHLGVQLTPFLAIEGSLNNGLVREYDMMYENGPFTTRHVHTRWSTSTFSVTPAITFAGPGYVHLLGLRVGQAVLKGHVQDDAFGTTGSYDSDSTIIDYGLLFRTSCILANHFSVGLELGYDLTRFTNVSNGNGTGTYGTPHSPERNITTTGHNGDQTTLDFSGGHVAVLIGLWSGAPVSDDNDGDSY